jgi:hypothetical protein
MARCAVSARVQRAERMLKDVRIIAHVAPLNAAPDGAARHPYQSPPNGGGLASGQIQHQRPSL